jgi:uncharacterized protein YqeY
MWGDRAKIRDKIIEKLKENNKLTNKELWIMLNKKIRLRQSSFDIYCSDARKELNINKWNCKEKEK